MKSYQPLLVSLALAALAAWPAAAAEPSRDLDIALKEQASKILDYARAHSTKNNNIAVLKFLVRSGDAPFSDNVGPLNMGLANRLTVALILALPNEDIGVIANANEALEKSGASYT